MILIRKKTLFIAAALAASALLAVVGTAVSSQTSVSVFNNIIEQNENRSIIIIDAGHGGEDGGAVAGDGTVESAINLAIAEKISSLCDFVGAEKVMLRTSDVSLADASAKTLHQKKVSDLKNRVLLINSYKNRTLVSIHQNSLPSAESVRGAQVFYNGVDGSFGDIAAVVQEALNASVNGVDKAPKRISDTIYLMKNAECRAVLVECGFLSNPDETRLLCGDEYQKKLAVAILSGILAGM
jgi:N-acetylmuramoyl-L-alanine amidase